MSLGRVLKHVPDDAGKPKRGTKRNDWLFRVEVIDFLERLKIENITQATADEINFSCPFPGHDSGDSRPSAYMNDGTKDRKKATAWKCHGCGRQGNAISFYAEHENTSRQDARRTLREVYAPDFRAPRGGSISAEFEERLQERIQTRQELEEELYVIGWERYRKAFSVNWDDAHVQYKKLKAKCPPEISYMFDRGFTKKTLKAWGIGYDEISERLTLPICDPEGDVLGVKARAWKRAAKPKYLILGDRPDKRKRYGWPHYFKSEIVFGIDKAIGSPWVVLCEGELDVIACWQCGIPAIATGSAAVSETQQRIIRDYFDEVIMFFDSNTAGEHGTFGYFNDSGEWKPGVAELLMPFVKVRVVEDHEDDPAQLVEDGEPEELHRLVADAASIVQLLTV